MKRLDRYVLGSFFSAWFAAFVFFCGMYLVIHFFNKLGDLADASEAFRAEGWTPFYGFCLYYGLNLPFVIVQTAPFTILMGAMWAVQQMARKNELVPVLVGGISFRRLAMPILVAGFLLALAFAGIRESVLPEIAEDRHRVERLFKGKVKESPTIRPPQIRDPHGRIWHIREYEIATKTAYGVNIVTAGPEARPRRHWQAIRWQNGRWTVAAGDPGDETILVESDLTPRDIELESRSLLFLDVGDLRRMIGRYPHRSNLRLLLHAHFAYPLGAMVLLLMGLPLVMRATGKSPFVAAGASLLLSIAFFAVSSVLQDLGGRDEVLNPVLGAWLPIILFGAVGLILFETMRT